MPVLFMCSVFKVSRSGYYAWLHRKSSARAVSNNVLVQQIKRLHKRSHGIYGSPRITAMLLREGVAVSVNRVARLMREEGIVGRIHYKKQRAPAINEVIKRTGNKRLFSPLPCAINQVWVGDVTYLWQQKKWWYLAVVMDVYSRKIIGWALETHRKKELTIKALRQAVQSRQPKSNMLFHSDRGSEYAAQAFREVLAQHGIIPSMNRPGHCTDNAHVESFFHSLKGEWISGVKYDTVDELRKAIRTYIVHFYNKSRLHSSLNYCSPNEFERLLAQ